MSSLMGGYTCDTCGHPCATMLAFDEHVEDIAERRKRFGDDWQLTVRQRYLVVDTDVETEPEIANTRAFGNEDR